VLEAKDLPVRVTASPGNAGPLSLAEAEKLHIQAVLETSGWNITRAARVLDVDRVTLYHKMRRYGVSRPGVEPVEVPEKVEPPA
jgi:transcriptional regulator of acetoin/glycerol metabolism